MARTTLENIVSQIREKRNIKQRNVVNIRKDTCKCESYLLEIKALTRFLYRHDISMGKKWMLILQEVHLRDLQKLPKENLRRCSLLYSSR